jgi:hypothetical protein
LLPPWPVKIVPPSKTTMLDSEETTAGQVVASKRTGQSGELTGDKRLKS